MYIRRIYFPLCLCNCKVQRSKKEKKEKKENDIKTRYRF